MWLFDPTSTPICAPVREVRGSRCAVGKDIVHTGFAHPASPWRDGGTWFEWKTSNSTHLPPTFMWGAAWKRCWGADSQCTGRLLCPETETKQAPASTLLTVPWKWERGCAGETLSAVVRKEYSVKSCLYHSRAKGHLKIFASFLSFFFINEMVDKGKRCRSRSVLGRPRAVLPFQSSVTCAVPQLGPRVLRVLPSCSGAGGTSSCLHLCACTLYLCAASWVSEGWQPQNLMHRALFPAEIPPVEKVFLLEVKSDVIFEGLCSLIQRGTGAPGQILNVPLFECF